MVSGTRSPRSMGRVNSHIHHKPQQSNTIKISRLFQIYLLARPRGQMTRGHRSFLTRLESTTSVMLALRPRAVLANYGELAASSAAIHADCRSDHRAARSRRARHRRARHHVTSRVQAKAPTGFLAFLVVRAFTLACSTNMVPADRTAMASDSRNNAPLSVGSAMASI